MAAQSFKLDDIFSVKGKVVLITGGGTGIGKALTAGFSQNGAKVYISGRRKDVLDATAKEIGGDITTITGDVATKAGCKAIADAVGAKEGKLDTLVNCAGVSRPPRVPIKDHNDPDQVERFLWDAVEDDDFNFTNQINVNGVYFLTAALIPLLRKSDNPSVVVIASIAGLALQRSLGTPTYGASKAAAMHLSSLMASRLHPFKIRVNTICPGIFPSEMTGSSGGQGHSYDLNDGTSKAGKRSTIGRPGLPEEIVGPVLLLSSKAGGYMDNATLVVDGGRLMAAGIHDGLRLAEDTYI